MRRSSRIFLLLSLLLALVGSSTTALASAQDTGTPAGIRYVRIPAAGGVTLGANVIEPGTPGPHPAVVFINSWTQGNYEYLAQAAKFAQRGYVVLSYTTRGVQDSGGQTDIAGEEDQADVSTVLDWLIANTSADPARIGASGVSLGSGLSLLGAARDPRIRAVGSLSTWGDLVPTLSFNGTPRAQVLLALGLGGLPTARLRPEQLQLFADALTDQNRERSLAFARERSPITYLDALNRNKPAVLLANALGESIFGPNQLTGFFEKLDLPKRLELAPGDHATAEISGLLGIPNPVWDSVGRWFDHYLAGQDTGIQREPAVKLTTSARATESYPDWASVSRRADRIPLGARGPVLSGVDSPAHGGVAVLSNALAQFTGVRPPLLLPTVLPGTGAVWQGPVNARPQRLRGTPRVHLTATPSASSGTVVAYLYDVDAFGAGALITHAPYSYSGVTPGEPLPIDLALEAEAYDLPAGHRLALVADTKDLLYADKDQLGSTISFTEGGWLDIPAS
ncbi:CocE/NonD family hydrolase [Amycolatopsis nigrescens]|uniref:CocE/NonD family hydrolase n=1 Tax=Amycolatopsis nigrescens TaxID=381445 RepID=UPI00039A3C58|nr:CocE/NonD family hydrolase [Amycolatopsis nigrescens]